MTARNKNYTVLGERVVRIPWWVWVLTVTFPVWVLIGLSVTDDWRVNW